MHQLSSNQCLGKSQGLLHGLHRAQGVNPTALSNPPASLGPQSSTRTNLNVGLARLKRLRPRETPAAITTISPARARNRPSDQPFALSIRSATTGPPTLTRDTLYPLSQLDLASTVDTRPHSFSARSSIQRPRQHQSNARNTSSAFRV